MAGILDKSLPHFGRKMEVFQPKADNLLKDSYGSI